MFRRYFKRLLAKNKEFLLSESLAVRGFMQLLMKQRNTGEKWTKEEKRLLKQHLKKIALVVPAIIVFLPPGGSILLPILVDLLDRRKNIRRPDAVLPQQNVPDAKPALAKEGPA
jgi:hypothetical protein